MKMKFTDLISFVGTASSIFSGEKAYISTGAVDNFTIKKSEIEKVTYDNRPSRANLTAKTDDVLFAKMAETLKTLRINDDLADCIFSTGFCAVRANRAVITPQCLYYLVSSPAFLEQKDKHASGATQRAITNSGMENISINIPPLAEQETCTKKLDSLTLLIAKRKNQLSQIDKLVKSQFIEMFGNYDLGTHKYGTQRLGELSVKISDGVHSKPNYVEQGRPFISVQNINSGEVDFDNCKFVSEEAYQKMIKSTHPEKGDILYTKVGATYGIPAYVDTEIDFCLYVSVCLIKPKPELINPRFLAASMGMRYVKQQADKRIKGIGVPDLHLNQIREFDIVVPPMELQNEFVGFIEQTDKSKFRIKQSLEKLEICYKALLQKYFG